MQVPYINLEHLDTLMGLLAMAAGIYISLTTRRKAHSEADKAHNEAVESLTRAAKNIVESNQLEMEYLRVGDVQHEGYINYLLEGIFRLQQQIRGMGAEPVFNPLPIQIYNKKSPSE